MGRVVNQSLFLAFGWVLVALGWATLGATLLWSAPVG